MGLHVHVFRWSLQDCTAGGISSRADALCIVNVEGPFEPDDRHLAAMLVSNNVFGDDVGRRLIRIVPAQNDGSGNWEPVKDWTMMGGNYGASSDSRFREAAEKLLGVFFSGAVPIHDRIEN